VVHPRREEGATVRALLLAWWGCGGHRRRKRCAAGGPAPQRARLLPRARGWQRGISQRGAEVLSLPEAAGARLDGGAGGLRRRVDCVARPGRRLDVACPSPPSAGSAGAVRPPAARRADSLRRRGAGPLGPRAPVVRAAGRRDGSAGGRAGLMTYGMVDHLRISNSTARRGGLMVGSGEAAGKGIVAPEAASSQDGSSHCCGSGGSGRPGSRGDPQRGRAKGPSEPPREDRPRSPSERE